MNEKTSVNDMLSSINTTITAMTYAIEHSSNKNFRDMLINARTEFEKLQWDTYLIAKDKGFYIPAAPAGEADLLAVKQAISG